MALQPAASAPIDRTITAPFLLRLFWRQSRLHDPWEFSVAPPPDTSHLSDYSSLLPSAIRQQSVQIYTWPNCTLGELTTLFTSVLPEGVMGPDKVGTRLVFKLIFPDTRATIVDGGRGKWIDKPLGSVVIGGAAAELDGEEEDTNGDGKIALEGDSAKTLADARFVIGDYVTCSIYPPGADGSVAPLPAPISRGPPRDGGFGGPRGAPLRENGFGGGGYGRGGGGGGYRGGYAEGADRGGGFGGAPPPGDWRRGERPPSGFEPSRGGGYRGRGGRHY